MASDWVVGGVLGFLQVDKRPRFSNVRRIADLVSGRLEVVAGPHAG